jgi:nicotinate-nucleotide pyrophosphorylase
MSGTVEVEAGSIEEAIEIFERDADHIELPDEDNCSYVDSSFLLTDYEVDFIKLFQQ